MKEWPEVWREAFDERVAIMISDGRLPLEIAQREALAAVRREFAL